MKRISILIFAIFMLNIFSQEVWAMNFNIRPNIDIIGEGAILIEEETEEVLYDKNIKQKMYPASTTKIMTAIIALEYGDLADIVTVGKEIEAIPSYSNKANLRVGDSLSLHHLLYGLLLPSGNDAANTIAVHTAKKVTDNLDLSNEEAYKIFADLMNQKAEELGANYTNFINPHGFHHENQYTTPLDIAIIGKAAMNNETFREIVGTQEARYYNEEIWQNTNHLILENDDNYYPYTIGIKTGKTAAAGKCLVSFATKDNLDLVAVVLNSTDDDIWEDSISLLTYGFENFEKYYLVNEGQKILTIDLENEVSSDFDKLDIISESTLETFISKSDVSEIKEEIVWNNDYFHETSNDNIMRLSSTVNKGDQVGIVKYVLNGIIIEEGVLLAGEDIKLNIGEPESIPLALIYGIIILIITSVFIISKNRKAKKEYKHYN